MSDTKGESIERIAQRDPTYDQLRAERDTALARAEAAEACTTCDGHPHASGKVCICGGSGRRSDETLNLRRYAQTAEVEVARWKAQFESTNAAGIGAVEKLTAAEERVRVLEALAKDALDDAWSFASSTRQGFCVHGVDSKDSCPMNSPALKALEAALAKAAAKGGHDDDEIHDD